MPKPAVALLLADAAPTREGGAITGFSGVAYSGGVVPNHGWSGDMAIDLGSMTLPRTDVPILLNHDPNQIVGRAAVANDGTQLSIVQGRFSAVTDAGKEVAALMAEGHPWSLSVGVNARRFDADRSKPTKLNGRSLAVDTVLRDARLLEVSFVPSGADPSAYAAQLSARMGGRQSPAEESPMADENAALAARITELEAQVATLTTERDSARTELANHAKAMRQQQIATLFGADAELTDAQRAAYIAMSAEQFDAVKAAVEKARKAADPTLFSRTATNGRNHEAGAVGSSIKAPAGFDVDPALAQLDVKARQYMAQHPNTEYLAAVAAVQGV